MLVRPIMLLCAGAAAVGVAFGATAPRVGSGTVSAASAPRVRGGPGTLGATPQPRVRGGPGTLGGYLGRRPSRGVRRVYPFYPGYYGSRFYDGFYYDPFFSDPFAIDPWGSYYS